MHQRQHLLPEDIQAVLAAVVDHRLAEAADGSSSQVSQQILSKVPVLL